MGRHKKEKPKPFFPRPVKFFYERDTYTGGYRWWRSDNPGDVFDNISEEELKIRIAGAEMCKVPVVDHLPGFCSLGKECPDHLGYY
jgi:hypothetical protein